MCVWEKFISTLHVAKLKTKIPSAFSHQNLSLVVLHPTELQLSLRKGQYKLAHASVVQLEHN